MRLLIRRIPLAMIAVVAIMADPASAEERPVLRIAGSDSMGPLMRALASEYGTRRPGFLYELDTRGSGTAPPLLLRGEAQIAAMTRELNALELRAFDARYGRAPMRVPIVIDAVAVIVSATNPIARLNSQQIDAIFSATRRCGVRGGQITTWEDAGASSWKDEQIGVVVTPRTSGTREYFVEHALCGGEFVAGARELPGTRSVLHALVESPDSIGYASSTALTPAVRAVPLEGRFGRLYSPTSADDVRSGKYPLARSLFLYAVAEPNGAIAGEAAAFISFVLSEAGQVIAEERGFLRLAPKDLTASRAALD